MKSQQSYRMRRNPFQSLQNLYQPKLSDNTQSDDILVLKEKIIELEAIIEEKDQQIEEYLDIINEYDIIYNPDIIDEYIEN